TVCTTLEAFEAPLRHDSYKSYELHIRDISRSRHPAFQRSNFHLNVRLQQLLITTRQTTELLDFASSVTFLCGPVGTGKSTVARLVDYCLGGDLERTPAIQQEFVAAQLVAELGDYSCEL